MTVDCLVMVKQICAVIFNGVEQFCVGIWFGLNDTAVSTITIGFDLEMDTARKYMRVYSLVCMKQSIVMEAHCIHRRKKKLDNLILYL